MNHLIFGVVQLLRNTYLLHTWNASEFLFLNLIVVWRDVNPNYSLILTSLLNLLILSSEKNSKFKLWLSQFIYSLGGEFVWHENNWKLDYDIKTGLKAVSTWVRNYSRFFNGRLFYKPKNYTRHTMSKERIFIRINGANIYSKYFYRKINLFFDS